MDRARVNSAAVLAGAAAITAYAVAIKFVTTKTAGVRSGHFILVCINSRLATQGVLAAALGQVFFARYA